MSAVFLHDLKCLKPPHSLPQGQSLQWLQESYLRYQKKQIRSEGEYQKLLARVAVSEQQIAERFYFLPDFHRPALEAKIFGEHQALGISQRQKQFAQITEDLFTQIYEERILPEHLIHVTCTGYGSPSAAQLVASRKSPSTVVTHSYHMGCYGAFPALRMAAGFLSAVPLQKKSNGKVVAGVDIVHTELCTLHLDPRDPSLEQIVIQSLFSDGAAVYRLSNDKPQVGFEILHLGEFLLPHTEGAMHWSISEQAMEMGLSKDVPSLIANSLRETLLQWEQEIGFPLASQLKDAIVAVHPGGPKIIDLVKETLELSEEQVSASRQILFQRGNMSSATLPHVWEKILAEKKSQAPLVLSMAFGPGLTLALSLMRVVK